jgi:5'-phosphate synthase pdxT subunit
LVKVGVLALQGAFARHVRALTALGCAAIEVRTASELDSVDALVMPGGESTTVSRLLVTSGVFDELKGRLADGFPVFGTCAGMILLATDVLDGRPDQVSFGAIEMTVRRNGYGRQVDSFETDLEISGFGPDEPPFHAVFIRAPIVVSAAPDVEVLARHDDRVVLARHDAVFVASFHPELTADARLHARFLQEV